MTEEPFIPVECRPAVCRELADEAWTAARYLIEIAATRDEDIKH